MALFSGMTLGAGQGMYNPFGISNLQFNSPQSTIFGQNYFMPNSNVARPTTPTATTSVARPTTPTNTNITNPTNTAAASTVTRPTTTATQSGYTPIGTTQPTAQTTQAPPAPPQGFNFATGNYTFGPGTVGRYNGQYVFRDPVTNRYLSTGNQAQAYLRAFGTDGNPLTFKGNTGYVSGQGAFWNPTFKTGQDLFNMYNRNAAFGIQPAINLNQANELVRAGGLYQQNANAFGTLYDKLLGGTFSGANLAPALSYLQKYSQNAANAYNQYNTLANQYLPKTSIAGMSQIRDQAYLPQQKFILPKETWSMSPQQLVNWINNHERRASQGSFMDKLAWTVGPALITGGAGSAIAGALGAGSGLAGKAIGSAIGTGIERGLGINNKAAGGLASLVKKGQRR